MLEIRPPKSSAERQAEFHWMQAFFASPDAQAALDAAAKRWANLIDERIVDELYSDIRSRVAARPFMK